MRQTIVFILTFFLLGCSDKTSHKTITIGEYAFDFPNDFHQIEEEGIDSYVGKIKGDGIGFGFDYGYYSNRLVETEQEYIDKKYWLQNAEYQFMKTGISYDNNNRPKTELINVRQATNSDDVKFKNVDFIAICKHDTIVFEYPITFPR